jgi:RNA polymerase sigma-70 factor (ECF subfamily)
LQSRDETIWTLIERAGSGDAGPRNDFVRVYLPLVRSYLGERWRGGRLASEIEDAAQDALIECLKEGGLLERAERGRPRGFRAFLFGAVRNVARRYEAAQAAPTRPHTESSMPSDSRATDDGLGGLLDREWARTLMREAAEHHRRTALVRGATAREGVELLRLRFEEGLAIRDIARRWGREAAEVHRRYRQARQEFQRSLRRVVAFHQPETAEIDQECRRLLELLGGD